MYSAQMQNTSIPSMGWREWTGPELQLVLSPESTVLLREGDSVLAYVEDSGQLEIYGYRPRAEH